MTTTLPAERPAGRTPASPDADRQAHAVALQLAVAGWAITRRPAASHPPDPAELPDPAA